jgi:hypothetical protein
MAAIARRADGEEAIAASTDFLAKRRVHDVEAAARFDWTSPINRGTTADDRLGSSKHRGGHRGPGASISRPFTSHRRTAVSLQHHSSDFEGALGGSCYPSIGALTTAAERLQGSSLNVDQEQLRAKGTATGVQIYAVSDDC